MRGSRGQHGAAAAILLACNMTVVAAVAAVVVHFINDGVIDNTSGLVVIGLVSGAAVSVISTAVYERLKIMLGLNSWQKGVDAKLEKLDKLDDVLEGQQRIIDLLEKYLPAIAAGIAALSGTPVPPPPACLPTKPAEPAPPPNVGQGGVQGSGGTAHMWRSVDGDQPRSL